MAGRRIDIAPELIAEGRRLYERTQTPLRDVAAMMGISRRTLENRIRALKWKRRRIASRPIELHHAVRGAAIATITGGEAAGADNTPVSPQRRAALAERIQSVVERQMTAVERVLAVVGPADQAEAGDSARTLASIARTLREIAALNLPDEEGKAADDANDDPVPGDIDEFRRELARRIRGFIEARRHGADRLSAEPEAPLDRGG